MYIYTYIPVCVNRNAKTLTHVCKYRCIFIHIYIYTYVYTYIHIVSCYLTLWTSAQRYEKYLQPEGFAIPSKSFTWAARTPEELPTSGPEDLP